MAQILGGGPRAQKTTRATALNIQTSLAGQPIPIMWGRNRIGGNLIWYGDFKSTPQKQGGKGGGGGGGKGASSYIYSASMYLALCEGQLSQILTVYSDKTTNSLSYYGMTFIPGSYTQNPWGYLTTNHSTEAYAYRGIAAVACGPLNLGSSPEIPQLTYEAESTISNAISGLPDANPKDIVTDLLTNIYYGLGFQSEEIGDLTAYSDYCLASGIVISPVYKDQAAASDFLNRVMAVTNSMAYFSQGKLCITPLGDQAVTANGHTYTPPSAPEYDFDDADFLPLQAAGSLPGAASVSTQSNFIQCSRQDPADIRNIQPISFSDRANQYNRDTLQAHDDASINEIGEQQADIIEADAIIADRGVAAIAASLQLGRLQTRNYFQWTAGRRFARLDPTDIVTLTDPALNLDRQWVRITEITENDDRTLTFIAEEYLAGTGAAAIHTSQTNSGYTPDYNQSAGDVADPIIFDLPTRLTGSSGVLQTAIATSGGPLFGGAQVWISSDDTTYTKVIDDLPAGCKMGTLAASLASGSNPDTTHTLTVDLSESAGQLDSGTTDDADRGTTLCFVDGEFISFSDVTPVGTYEYDLDAYLRRGWYGSGISSHSSGSPFARCDENLYRVTFAQEDVGRTVYFKILSYNLWKQGLQQLSDVASWAHVIGGPPVLYAPESLSANQTKLGITLRWVNPANIGVVAIEIWRSTSSSFAGATHLADAPAYATTYTDKEVDSGDTYWYWIRVRDLAGRTGQYDPSDTGAGASATPGLIGTSDLGFSIPDATLLQASYNDLLDIIGPGAQALIQQLTDLQDSVAQLALSGAQNLHVAKTQLSSSLGSSVASLNQTLLTQADDISATAAQINSLSASFNSSLATVNATLVTQASEISVNSSAITSLTSSLATTNSNVSSNASAISGLTTSVSANTSDIAANASAITSINTSVGKFSASGLFRVDTHAALNGASATVALSAAATSGGASSTAAMFLSAMSGGTSQIILAADKIFFTDGTNFNDAFEFSGGTLYVKNARIANLTADNLDNNAATIPYYVSPADVTPVTGSLTTWIDIPGATVNVTLGDDPQAVFVFWTGFATNHDGTNGHQVLVRLYDSTNSRALDVAGLVSSPGTGTSTTFFMDDAPHANATTTYKIQFEVTLSGGSVNYGWSNMLLFVLASLR